MKTAHWNKITGLLCATGLFAVLHFAHAQTTSDTGSAVTTDPDADVSNLSDMEVELKALEMAMPLAASNVPASGNFYSAQHAPGSATPWPPFPGNIFHLNAWPLDTNIFVLDDLNFDYNGASAKTSTTASAKTMEADLEGPPTPPGGGGGDTNSPSPQVNEMPDYGTNLFFASLSMVSGNLTGIASNTLADVEYAIQTNSDLTTTNWADDGQFILGSEVTNWTQFILPQPISTNNLFFRLQSQLSSNEGGIPNWWALKYLSQDTNFDPFADPTGDGWTLLEDYENDWNPNTFKTPPAPSSLTVIYNASSGTSTISWLPSPGAVTGYTVEKTDSYAGTVNDLSASTTNYEDSLSDDSLDPYIGNIYAVSYRMRANYTGGFNSPWSASVPLQSTTVFASIVPGAGGVTELAVSGVPANAATVKLVFLDQSALENGSTSFDYTENVPVSSLTNGLYQLPTAWQPPGNDAYGQANYEAYVETVDTNGNASGVSLISPDFWNTPFYDGRVQLKQNLIFQLRVASMSQTFSFYPTNINFNTEPVAATNYVVSSYDLMGSDDPLAPFKMNNFYRNFVYDASALDTNDVVTNGISDSTVNGISFSILNSPAYQTPRAGVTNFTALLGTDLSPMLVTSEFSTWGDITDFGMNEVYTNNAWYIYIITDGCNLYGLPYLSEKVVDLEPPVLGFYNLVPNENILETLDAGYPIIYPNTAQPGFQTVEYDFWNGANTNIPGSASFSVTNTSDILFVGVGNNSPTNSLGITAFAKLAVTNGYPGVYGYLGQYFTNAFEIGTNGVVTANTTGVLSPYGSFFPTQPGPVALVTMPDPDTGLQGTGIVNCVSLNVDKNHDGTMDLSFNGPDATSQASPDVVWVNNRFCTADGDLVAGNGIPPNYSFGAVTPDDVIYGANAPAGQAGVRDLENFFRLWLCGMPALTNGYQVSLSWTNVSSGNPAINLYQSVEADGGTGYLTETNIAAQQAIVEGADSDFGDVGTGAGVAVAEITNGLSYTFPINYFTNSSNKYFLFEGAGIGTGELVLTITDNNGNQIAQTGVWLDLQDVDTLFQRVKVTPRDPNGIPEPYNEASTFDETTAGVDTSNDGYVFTPPANEDKAALVFVHGSNLTVPAAIDNGETMFKRLYWQGYTGRFVLFYWNTLVGPFTGTIPAHYNQNEYRAFKYGLALKNYVENDLPSGYRKNVVGHSMGNIVVTSALYPRGSTPGMTVSNVIFMQAAVPASCYDPNAATLPVLDSYENPQTTPDEFNPQLGYRGLTATNINATLYNIYNPQDYALGWWVNNQKDFKPENLDDTELLLYGDALEMGTLYEWSTPPPQGSLEYDGATLNRLVTDPQESMAFIARSRTAALGTTNVNGSINAANNFNVGQGTPVNLGNLRPDHSGEFTRPIQQLNSFYNYIYLRVR